MKKHIISILVLFLLLSTSFVGVSNQEKQETVDIDKSELPIDGDPNYNILHTNETPGIQWSRQYGALDNWDHFWQVRTAVDGGYILVGDSQSYGPNHCIAAWLLKTDSDGHEEWNKSFGTYVSMGTKCQQTSDGGYAFCGVNDNSCFMLVKTDAQGNEQWIKSYDNGTAWCFQQTTDEGYIIAGYPEMYIRTDSQGNVLWKKTYFDSHFTRAASIEQTIDGGFIVTGGTDYYSHGDHENGFLLKLDPNGTKEWDITFIISEISVLESVLQTPDNGFIAGGTIADCPWIVRTDQAGRELWNKTYIGVAEIVEDIVLTNDGGFALVGNDGHYISYIMKSDATGIKKWEFLLGGYLTSLQQAADESIIVCGINESIDTQGNGILMKIGHVPRVEITKPTKAIYLFDKKIRDFFMTIVLGGITVDANASDTKYNIERVEFAIDDVLKYTDTTTPYSWKWATLSFFPRTLTVTVYNTVGNCSSKTINLLKIF
jgi:hypothetical protein